VIMEGSLENPTEKEIQISVQSLEQISVRLGSLNYIDKHLSDQRMYYKSVLNDQNIKSLKNEIRECKHIVVQKIGIQFWTLAMHSLFLKYLYFDYGIVNSPNSIMKSSADIKKVMSLAENFLPEKEAKMVIKDMMKYLLIGKGKINF
jgi:hypothetical protein